MKRFFVVLVTFFALIAGGDRRVIAVENPNLTANNKIGIHVLDPNEVMEAAKLVNGDTGAWGYVTVPIQATDRNREKWIRFMRQAAENRVIPIVRVATVVSGLHWDEPNNYDLVDFANFLNDLPWPTKNRYVVIFNEVNRADEYGGYVSPEKYADTLMNAMTIFKERSADFFILPAGMDNAAASNGESLHWRSYWERVVARQPEILEKIDGWTSHAYPNPGFRGRPTDRTDRSIASFRFELDFVSRRTDRDLPVFITETGWDMSVVDERVAASYLKTAHDQVWNDPRIVAITPFLLRAGAGPFVGFSFLDMNGQPREVYQVWRSLAVKGEPVLNQEVLEEIKQGGVVSETKDSSESIFERFELVDWEGVWLWLARILGLNRDRVAHEEVVEIGGRKYWVEVADTNDERIRGLSGRSRLKDNEGMLFVFENKDRYAFWMKEMRFDIYIVWISSGKVVGIDNASYATPYKRIWPNEEVDMVLEVVDIEGIKIGDEIKRFEVRGEVDLEAKID